MIRWRRKAVEARSYKEERELAAFQRDRQEASKDSSGEKARSSKGGKTRSPPWSKGEDGFRERGAANLRREGMKFTPVRIKDTEKS